MTGTDLHIATRLLQQGELVAIPTETVYGLAGNAFDAGAVTKIYKTKNRPQFNPLIMHVHALEQLTQWGLRIPEKMQRLAVQFSPGPLTYVIPKSDRIPDLVTAGTDAVAVRIPAHPLALALLKQLDFPLAAPSANPSGFVSPTSAAHVEAQLGDKVPYILDGGPCRVGLESTIISFLQDTPEVLRFGGLPLEQIEAVIGEVRTVMTPKDQAEDQPVAPGMLSRHYAMRHPLERGNVAELITHHDPVRTAIISFYRAYTQVPAANQFVLSPAKNLDEAAQQLFAAMRNIDQLDVDVVLADIFPEEGLGRAINDRLKRAAVPA